MIAIPLDIVRSLIVDPLAPGETAEREFDIAAQRTGVHACFVTVSSTVPVRLALRCSASPYPYREAADQFSMILGTEPFVGMLTVPGTYRVVVKNLSHYSAAVHINVTSS